jgi:two-component sensor histidine kinase
VNPTDQSAGRIDRETGAASPARVQPRRRASLLLQIAVLLTVALIPIGMVAVIQTQRAIEAAREIYLDSLRAQTMEAATPQREGIMRAIGLARGLSDAVAVLAPDGEACDQLMRRSAATNSGMLFVGVIEPPGISRCNNTGEAVDFTANPASARLFADPKGDVRFNAAGDVSGQPVVILSEPIYRADGTFLGFVSLSYPATTLRTTSLGRGDSTPAVVLFNARGEVLTTTLPDRLEDYMPADRSLIELPAADDYEFSVPSRAGPWRDYAVVPIAPGRAYALGSWTAEGSRLGGEIDLATSIAFPLAMWLVSMIVALVSIHQLVIHPIRDLGRRMRGFADGRRILHAGALRNAPGEIDDIGNTFETMARKIIRDEADLENTLFERGVLLKEVHHRVKNNLQLMSSILNMQARKVRSEEARRALRDVQERLRSLAAIHRGLYQAPELSQVQFDELLAEIVAQLVSIAPERLGGGAPVLDLADVRLVPDQAAPLAMLTAEMLTNSLKYVGEDAEGRRGIAVTLGNENVPEGERIVVTVSNTVRPGSALDRSDGLGRRLMEVLAQQLGGELRNRVETDHYSASISFLRTGLQPEDDGAP